MTQPSILIAGIGNIFMGDDAFGVEVANRLAGRELPEGVRVVDFGIRGFDLAYALMDDQDVTILIDAAPRGGEPGTLYTIEPDLNEVETLSNDQMAVEPHGMNPMKVLAMVKSMGGELKRILLVGCEPATLGPEEGLMGLSAQFTVRAFAGGMLSALGHNPTIAIRDFEGEVRFLPDTLEVASLRISIKADSLTVTDDVSEKDRLEMERQMREDVLETAKYPEIIFESTSVSGDNIFEGQYRVTINGRLSLHGVTRDCAIPGQVIASEDSVRSNGEFTLRQTDYGIKLVSAAGGTIKLKDELKFTFDIVARRENV